MRAGAGEEWSRPPAALSAIMAAVIPSTGYRRGLLALIGAVLIWSSTYVLIKGMLDDIGPFVLAVARFAVALAVLVPMARRHGFRWRMAVDGRWLRFGAAGVTLYFGLQNLGLVFTTAGSAALITAAIPALTAVVAYFSLGERLRPRQVAGVLLSVLGVAMVVRSGLDVGDARTLLGNLFVLAACLAWAVYTVQGRRLSAEVPAVVASTAGIAAGTLLLLPMAAGEWILQGPPTPSLALLGGVLYLGVAASALAFLWWNSGLRHVPASAAAAMPNLVPVVGLGLAVAVGEPVAGLQIAGGALAVAGVVLSQAPSGSGETAAAPVMPEAAPVP